MGAERVQMKYSEAIRDAAELFEVGCLCPQGCNCADRNAALRDLLRIMKEVEEWQGDPNSGPWLLLNLAHGYDSDDLFDSDRPPTLFGTPVDDDPSAPQHPPGGAAGP
jgi:hypothetical protein